MAYFDHIRRCNAHDLSRYRPWQIGGETVGWLRHDFVERLRGFPDVFKIAGERIALAQLLAQPSDRTEALHSVGEALAEAGALLPARGEPFPIAPRWGMEPFGEMDRRWVTHFGLPAYGVHLNGFVRKDRRYYMWLARRAKNKMTYPGLLDNLVAGGQPARLGLRENMIKEADEEAAIPPELAARIQPVGQVTYMMETEEGLKLDTLFNFDLELPPDFVPVNTDGEVEEFMLMPLSEVAAIVRESFDFKFNCSLVVIDFMIRHGFLTPDVEPAYVDLCTGLHAAFPITTELGMARTIGA